MRILDSSHITGQAIFADICIIGAGPAGMALAQKLFDSNLSVVIAESGDKEYGKNGDERNAMEVESNFRYRNSESKRNRQVGGTANLWAGRAVPFNFDLKFDKEWSGLRDAVTPYFNDAFRQLDIDPSIRDEHPHTDGELYGYWGDKTQRFKASFLRSNAENTRIYTNLTFNGTAALSGDRISELFFLNRKQQVFTISARRFVFAMGGIENSRMLLIMQDQIEQRMGKHFENVGKYVMDHPRLFHGQFTVPGKRQDLIRYQMKATSFGVYKTGIRNDATTTRVYCNLLGSPGRFTRKVLRIPFRRFQVSSKKLFLREMGILRTLAYQCRRFPIVNRSEEFSKKTAGYVNSRKSQNYQVVTYCEQRPRLQNQIKLDQKTDPDNLKIPCLINHIHPEELHEVSTFYRKLAILSEDMDLTFRFNEEYITNPVNYTDASHIMGGTRYSAEKPKAVVDEKLSVIGIPNLHITGSSLFPTSSVENPTHLILSLSLYLAMILKNELS
jgi:hypothetical protein